LGMFLLIALVDSFHFRPRLPPAGDVKDAAPAYSTRTLSLLDALLTGPREARERTYSVPFATHQYSKESILVDGKMIRDYPRLQFGGAHLQDTRDWSAEVEKRPAVGLAGGLVGATALWLVVAALLGRATGTGTGQSLRAIRRNTTDVPWRAMLATGSAV